MLNIIWPIFIIISYIYAMLTGNVENINNAVFNSTESAVSLTITLFGTMTLWNGLMEIASKTRLIDRLTTLLKPLINFLFYDAKKDEKIAKKQELSGPKIRLFE